MRKLLTLISLFVSLLAFGQTHDELGNLINPPGRDMTFQLYAWVRGGYDMGRKYYETHIRIDGDDVYFQDICPTAQTGSWVKGSYINENTIRILPQKYFTESTDAGNYTTNLVMWHGKKVGYDQEGTEYDHYDLIVGEDADGNMTLTYADVDDWLSVADVAQQGIYDFSSELVYTKIKDAPSTEMITRRPEGRYQRYAMQANYYNDNYGDFWADFGFKADVVWGDDGNVYFSTLTPDYEPTDLSGWIKGEYDKQTGVITVNPYQAVERITAYADTYAFLGNYNWNTREYLDTPLYFKVDADGSIYATDDAREQYPCVMYMQGSLVKGMCAINQHLTMFPVEEEPTVAPADVNAEDWSLKFSTTFTGEQSRLIKVKMADGVFYFQGLSSTVTDAWVKGELDGNTVTLTSNQLVASDNSNRYLYLCGGYYDETAEHPAVGGTIVFTYDAEAKTLKPAGMGETRKDSPYIIIRYATSTYTNMFDEEYYNPVMQYQGEWTPASPANPRFDVEFHFQDEYGNPEDNPYFVFYIPNVDVNGAYLDTSKLFYRIYWDMDQDDVYTFKADDYIYVGYDLQGDVQYMPYLYSDEYDIFVSGTKHTVYMYPDADHDYISLQSIYQYDGVNYESEFVTRNIGPYYVSHEEDGIKSVGMDANAGAIFNLQGQRLDKMQKGVNIVNGRKYIVK